MNDIHVLIQAFCIGFGFVFGILMAIVCFMIFFDWLDATDIKE